MEHQFHVLRRVESLKPFAFALIAAPLLWVMSITELQLTSLALGLGNVRPSSVDMGYATDLLAVIVVGPFVEEVVFRFAAIKLLVRWLPQWIAVVVSAALFSASHIQYAEMTMIGAGTLINIFLGGIALGAAYLCSGTLWIPIAMHVAYNGMSLLMNASALSTFARSGAWQALFCSAMFLASLAGYVLVCVRWRTLSARHD